MTLLSRRVSIRDRGICLGDPSDNRKSVRVGQPLLAKLLLHRSVERVLHVASLDMFISHFASFPRVGAREFSQGVGR